MYIYLRFLNLVALSIRLRLDEEDFGWFLKGEPVFIPGIRWFCSFKMDYRLGLASMLSSEFAAGSWFGATAQDRKESLSSFEKNFVLNFPSAADHEYFWLYIFGVYTLFF